ncbi:MAG TPA: hypothetical protein VHW68_00185 [Actinomycetota bacterium]|jgi:hypothetical protein|nr:hypothetical protein [Actinomycetota bacterium]
MPSYRLIDMAGGEIGIVEDDRDQIDVGERVTMPDGATAPVVDVYDDEFGQEGGVDATLAVDDGTV